MASEVRGVVAPAMGAPVTVETVIVPDPGPGEVVVKVQACGVCHTDLHYKDAFAKMQRGEVLRSVVVF